MGANQSSGGRTQQFPSTEFKSQKSVPNNKNSFTKNQLSRLLLNKKNVQQVSGGSQSKRTSQAIGANLSNSNEYEYDGDSNRSPMSRTKYFVPETHSQNIIDSSNGKLMKPPTINLAETYNELEIGAASPSSPTTNGYNIGNNNNNNNNSELISSNSGLKHKSTTNGVGGDHQFVNQLQHHSYQFQHHQVQPFDANSHHQQTQVRSNDNRCIVRAPPTGSNPVQTTRQAQSKHQLMKQQLEPKHHQQQQSHFNCSNNMPPSKQQQHSTLKSGDKHKAPQMKSSCSPSSASAASSSSSPTSSSSSTSIDDGALAGTNNSQQQKSATTTPTAAAAVDQRHHHHNQQHQQGQQPQGEQQSGRVVYMARIVSTQAPKQGNNIVAPLSGFSSGGGHGQPASQHVSGVDYGTGSDTRVVEQQQWKLNSSGTGEQRGQYNYGTAAIMKQTAYGNGNRLQHSGQQQQSQSHLQAPLPSLKPLVVATQPQQQQQQYHNGAHTNNVSTGGRQHQRAHSSGGVVVNGSLSWSKHLPQQKQANLSYNSNSGSNSNNNNANILTTDLLLEQFNNNFPHSHQIAVSSARNSLQTEDEIEQFYSRNLHLLTDHHQDQFEDSNNNQDDDDGLDPYNSLLLLNDQQQQQLQLQLAAQNSNNNSRTSYSTGTTPRQRRYKWPKQQYQYFNNSNNGNSGQFDYQTIGTTPQHSANHLRLPYGNQQQVVGGGGTLGAIKADYAANLLLLSDNNNQRQQQQQQLGNDPLIYYNNLNHYNNDEFDQRDHVYSSGNSALDSSSYVIPPPPQLQFGAASNNHKLANKSATLSMASITGANKPKKSRNPLAAIFPFTNSGSNGSGSNYTVNSSSHNNRANNNNSNQAASFKQQYNSNTIHLSSSKSHQNLLLQSSGGAGNSRLTSSSSGFAGGSLKRIKSSPLTAQQTSYEAMRTIDMYLIRQIARSCMDFEMEQKIDLEIRLRELASQSLLEARNEIDVLQVEKSLLTSDQRMNCYASQLEQQRKQLSNASLSTDSGRASKTSCYQQTRQQQQQQRRDGSQPRSTASDSSGGQQRSDVIGAPLATRLDSGVAQRVDNSYASEGTGSPSFSSMSKSSQSSPSKLSPVSGESANSPAGAKAGGQSSSSAASSCHRSRRSNNAVRQQSSGANTPNNRRNRLNSSGDGVGGVKSKKTKQREQLKQMITRQSNIDCNMVVDNRATLTISELRIPLMWRDVDHFKGRGDYKRYAVFCLLKINSQIYDTQLISDVDRQMTDLTFDDIITFNDVDHEYELTLEVYSCVYLEQFSLSSTPRKLREKLSNSVSRAMGRRLATHTASANYTKELEAYDKSYRFAMIASAKLGLVDASDSIKTYDLHLVSPEAHRRQSTLGRQHNPSSSDTMTANNNFSQYHNSNLGAGGYCGIVTASNQKDLHKNTLPLFGHFCCKLQVRPDVFDKCVKSGYLRIATIDLPNPVTKKQNASEELTSSICHRDNQRTKSSHCKSRSNSPADDSGKSSMSNDDLNTASSSDCSMLRSALAASSKLAAISMSNSTVHWALLRNFTLHLWHVDEQKLEVASRRGHAPQVDISGKQPFCINIDRHTRLLRVSNSSLTIETDKGCFVIAVHNLREQSHSHDEIGQWLRPIEQMIFDSHIWSSVLNRYQPSVKNKHSKQ